MLPVLVPPHVCRLSACLIAARLITTKLGLPGMRLLVNDERRLPSVFLVAARPVANPRALQCVVFWAAFFHTSRMGRRKPWHH